MPIEPTSGVPYLSPFASTNALLTTCAAVEASAYSNSASGSDSVMTTVEASGALTSLTFASIQPTYEPSFGSRIRFRLYTTSSTVIGVPSWNFTPWRILSV